MSGSGGHAHNPFALPEDPQIPAPPLNCAAHGGDPCHVDVGGSERNFRRFQERFDGLGKLAERGLLVVLKGPSHSGKTSLRNRCLSYAMEALGPDDQRPDAEALRVDLSDRIRQPALSGAQRVTNVGRMLAAHLKANERIFETPYAAPDTAPDDADLGHWTASAGDRLYPRSSVVLVTPPVTTVDEIRRYWAGVDRGFLIFVECSAEGLEIPEDSEEWAQFEVAKWMLLETGMMLARETRELVERRTSGGGGGFRKLASNATDGRFGVDGSFPVGTVQKLLYLFYREHGRAGSGGEVTQDELSRFIDDQVPRG
ncbi:hypothetical protein DZF91_35485 [Actinomadura logoneensis]|uniref:Uncharacterized protein n=1 Tax=Actinomadura logoneensis TaxID=2293572 RepID=A0A372JAW3_9ACTN|nr:hypothetical protein [Actinomadura logoneensis]RFU36944.1 hypothetical protein DZF91_35485 [Actinomadura logoneensis]